MQKRLKRTIYTRLVKTPLIRACGLRLTVKSSSLFHLFRDYDHVCIVLEKDSDLTGSGLVVGFANSSFEVLAGIGVFAALGFIATAQGVEVSEVAKVVLV